MLSKGTIIVPMKDSGYLACAAPVALLKSWHRRRNGVGASAVEVAEEAVGDQDLEVKAEGRDRGDARVGVAVGIALLGGLGVIAAHVGADPARIGDTLRLTVEHVERLGAERTREQLPQISALDPWKEMRVDVDPLVFEIETDGHR
jgi:hypothetical protein